MFGQLTANLVQFFIRKKWLFFRFFTAVIVVLANGFTKIKVEEDIYSIFPKGAEYKEFSEIVANNNLNRQVVFSVKSNEDVDHNYDLLDSLSEIISNQFDS